MDGLESERRAEEIARGDTHIDEVRRLMDERVAEVQRTRQRHADLLEQIRRRLRQAAVAYRAGGMPGLADRCEEIRRDAYGYRRDQGEEEVPT